MSYSLVTNCYSCVKNTKCTDQASISGALCGIHQMPFGVGHLGAGTVTVKCHNHEEKTK